LDDARIEFRGDGDVAPVRRQLELFTAGPILGSLTEAQVDEITVEAGVDQCADDLWEGERAVLAAGEAVAGDGLVFWVHGLVAFRFVAIVAR
jgi:hypothetical protein